MTDAGDATTVKDPGLTRRDVLGRAVAGTTVVLAAAASPAAAEPATADPRVAGAATAEALHRRRKARPHHRARSQPSVSSVLPSPTAVAARHANPADLGVLEAASLLQAGKLSSAELTAACQARISARNGTVTFAGSPTEINAWVRLYPELSRPTAQAADGLLQAARRAHRRTPLLCGIPVGLKDLYAVAGLPLTGSSKVLAGNVAAGDSTVWTHLKANGMVLLGHTHTHEWALGTLTPQCGNPWNLAMSVGGSSGGSAAALAARMIPAATGTDTGGSLRSPPNACGVSAIKPTFGLVSTHGVLPIAYSCDHAGVLARNAGDLGLLLSAIAGPDPADNASLADPMRTARYPTLPRPGRRPLAGIRIGMPSDAAATLPGALDTLYARAQSELRALGATIVEFAEPEQTSQQTTLDMEYAETIEAGVYHAQFYPARAAQYGTAAAIVVSADVALSQSVTSAQYIASQQRRAAYIAEWNAAFAELRLDAVLKPGADVDGSTRTATDAATPGSGVTGDYNWADFAGLPVVAFTVGLSAGTSLPFGVQLGGPPHSEAALLQIAIDYQAHTNYHLAVPPGLS